MQERKDPLNGIMENLNQNIHAEMLAQVSSRLDTLAKNGGEIDMPVVIEQIRPASNRLANALLFLYVKILVNDKHKPPTIHRDTPVEIASVVNMSILADALKVLMGKMNNEYSEMLLANVREWSNKLFTKYIDRNAPIEDSENIFEQGIRTKIKVMSEQVAERKSLATPPVNETGSPSKRRGSEPAVSVAKQGVFKPVKSTSAPPVLTVNGKVVDPATVHQEGGKYDLNKGPKK